MSPQRRLRSSAGVFLLLAVQAAPARGHLQHEHRLVRGPAPDLPARPGQLVRALYGPFTVPANGRPDQRARCRCPRPCTNCRITDMVPNLVFDGSGATANLDNGMMLHHFVLFNPAQQGVGCPISEPFFGAGNERTHLHLPTPFGYTNTSANWNLITHVVNKSATPRTVNVEVIYRWRPLSETADTRPLWLDIDSICTGGNSEYTIPTGLLRLARELDHAGGRPPHRHERPPARHRHHRPELVPDALPGARRRDRAVGRAGRRLGKHVLRPDSAQQLAAGRHHGSDAVQIGGQPRDLLRRRRTAATAISTPTATAGSSATCPRADRRRRTPPAAPGPATAYRSAPAR